MHGNETGELQARMAVNCLLINPVFQVCHSYFAVMCRSGRDTANPDPPTPPHPPPVSARTVAVPAKKPHQDVLTVFRALTPLELSSEVATTDDTHLRL